MTDKIPDRAMDVASLQKLARAEFRDAGDDAVGVLITLDEPVSSFVVTRGGRVLIQAAGENPGCLVVPIMRDEVEPPADQTADEEEQSHE